MRTPETQVLDFPANACLVMHTDGVSLSDSLPQCSAKTLAQSLVDLHGSEHDDASVLVLQRQRKIF